MATAHALLAGPLLSVAATPLLWLPLGDSITWGCGTDAAPRGGAACAADAGGYRVPIAWALSQQVCMLARHRMSRCALTMNRMLSCARNACPSFFRREHRAQRMPSAGKTLRQGFGTSSIHPHPLMLNPEGAQLQLQCSACVHVHMLDSHRACMSRAFSTH